MGELEMYLVVMVRFFSATTLFLAILATIYSLRKVPRNWKCIRLFLLRQVYMLFAVPLFIYHLGVILQGKLLQAPSLQEITFYFFFMGCVWASLGFSFWHRKRLDSKMEVELQKHQAAAPSVVN